MATDMLTTDTSVTDGLRLDDLRLGRLSVNDLEAASWGASWQPEGQSRSAWLDADEQGGLDDEALTSAAAWDLWPVLERLGQPRRLLIGP
jgi:hypothetical protein